MRGREKRNWVKIDCYGMLHGSINWQLTLEEQAIWVKSIAYAAVCGDTAGIIRDNDGSPFPHEYLASEFHCPLEVFESMLKKCVIQNRMMENEHGIEILNWNAYQFTEYDRVKGYQEAYRQRKSEKGPQFNPDYTREECIRKGIKIISAEKEEEQDATT